MAFPSGFDSFDEYMRNMYARQGMAPIKSVSAPASRQSIPQPHAPTGVAQGPLTSTGKGVMSTVGNQVMNRGTNSAMDWLAKYFSQSGAGAQPFSSAAAGGAGGDLADAGFEVGMDSGAGAGASAADAADLLGFL